MPLHRQMIPQAMSPSPSPSLKTIVLCMEIPQVEMTLFGMSHVEAVMLQEVTGQAGAQEELAIAQGALHSMEMTPMHAGAQEEVPAIAQGPHSVEMTPAQAGTKEDVSEIAQAEV